MPVITTTNATCVNLHHHHVPLISLSMNNSIKVVTGLSLFGLLCAPVSAREDDRRSGSQSQSQTQQQTTTNNNNSTNNNRAVSRNSSNNVITNANNISVAGSGIGSASGNNTYNALLYPDWVNVAPSQSSVGVDAVTCQGTTLTGGVSTLTTSTVNDQYGVQGTIGFSIPLTGQDDCRAISAAIKKRATVENAAKTMIACHQLALAKITPDLTKFPELSVCN